MQHLAIIPDGNRRWAVKHKLDSLLGHKKGINVLQDVMKVCIKNKIKYLSMYAFSLENFRRNEHEKKYLFNLIASEFKKYLPELIKQKIRVMFLGDRNYFPNHLKT